jgi:hypothetical protein
MERHDLCRYGDGTVIETPHNPDFTGVFRGSAAEDARFAFKERSCNDLGYTIW